MWQRCHRYGWNAYFRRKINLPSRHVLKALPSVDFLVIIWHRNCLQFYYEAVLCAYVKFYLKININFLQQMTVMNGQGFIFALNIFIGNLKFFKSDLSTPA